MSKNVPNGLVIVFEGIDGVGKTTQLELAAHYLTESGYQTISLRNLGGSPIGEQLREVMKSTTPRPPKTDLYVSVAIQEALFAVIAEARDEGKVILMDRSPISLAAYQSYGSGLDINLVMPYVQSGMDQMTPDLNILYQADVAKSIARARAVSVEQDYFESKSEDYFRDVERGYLAMAEKFPMSVVDASRSIDEIAQDTKNLINSILI